MVVLISPRNDFVWDAEIFKESEVANKVPFVLIR